MPHERDASRDMVLKHQHSLSESISSRSSLSIPMWDSSDPERAPPPLPLNPTTGSPITKSNISANVAAAAEAIANRARESQYVTNPSPTKSPEKSLIKDHHHKRLQSISNSALKDLGASLENARSLDRSPERSPDRSHSSLSIERTDKTPTRSESRLESLSQTSRDISKDTQSSRAMPRQPLKAILGEEPPQSATMRALHGRVNEDRDATPSQNKRDAMALVRTPQTIDAISSQILSLTTIATNLQQEMAALSRRSKDNATDLVSLKEATSSRDEDIRKTLRELVVNLNTKKDDAESIRKALPRTNGAFCIDEKPHLPPSTPKSISLPRIPSPASFAASIDRELMSSPTAYSTDGAAAIALLEKILREMGTKDGQEHIKHAIAELMPMDSNNVLPAEIGARLEEIVRLLKENTNNQAMVRLPDAREATNSKTTESAYDYSLHPAVALARATRNATTTTTASSSITSNDPITPTTIGPVNEEVTKLIKRIKDSVTESGGLTNEVKALVRELRGEVLGMGREIGRKLDAVEKNNSKQSNDGTSRDQMFEIIEDGLTQLKKHMDDAFREHRRQSAASAVAKQVPDAREVQTTILNTLRDIKINQSQPNSSQAGREEILEAVREAWETYKPEIEVKNIGLEPDEILECLEKGLQEYKGQLAANSKGASYEDVLDAVKQGLQDFKIPNLEAEPVLTREEILTTMRECLDTYDLPSRSSESTAVREDIVQAVKDAFLLHGSLLSATSSVSREDLLDAVKDRFINHEIVPRSVELNRDDLFEAVRLGIQEASLGEMNDQILGKVQDLLDTMRDDFQKHPAATAGDTEQILDVVKDGLESLRANVETYVDRAADVTGKDEIIETVKLGLDSLRADLESSIAKSRGPAPTSSGELLDVMEKEFEHLRTTLSTSLARSEGNTGGREELLDALRDGFEELKGFKPGSMGTAVEQEIRHLRETLASTMIRNGETIDRAEILEAIRDGLDRAPGKDGRSRVDSIISGTDEVLDALHDGFGKLKTDIEELVSKEGIEAIRNDIDRVVNEISRPIDMTVNYEILDLLKAGLASVQADTAKLVAQQDNISGRGKEVVVADAQTKGTSSRPDIENLEVMITQLKMKVDALDNPSPAMDHMALRPDFANLERMVKDLQDSMQNINGGNTNSKGPATKDDIEAIETILLNSKAKIDELSASGPGDQAKGAQVESLETLLKDISQSVDDLVIRQEDNLPTKVEFGKLESTIRDLQTNLEQSIGKMEANLQGADLEAVESLLVDVHDRLKDLVPEGEKIASQGAILDIQTLVKDLHDQTQSFQEKMLLEAELTAQAFDARKIEHGGLADKIEDVKAFLESVRLELKSQLETGEQGIEGLASTLTTLGETLTTANTAESLKEMRELIETKFGELSDIHHAGLESHGETFAEKQEQSTNTILEEITTKMDAHLNELIAKYDGMQTASEAKFESFETKTRDGIDAMLSTKAIADDLRLLIDTLGQTVTESCRNIAEDSKTVFTKVEQMASKQDAGFASLTNEIKEDHQLTRTDLARTTSTVDNIYTMIADHNPKVMEAIHDVLNVMSQHFEMAEKSTEEIKSRVKEIPASGFLPALPAPASVQDDSSESSERHDDSQLHSKLDQLVQFASENTGSAIQIGLLEHIKEQLAVTADKLEAFSSLQISTPAVTGTSRTKDLEDASIALEKRTAQKQAVEAEIVRLTSEKDDLHATATALKESVVDLTKAEKEMLSRKAKLQAELSSLETALQIRREDMRVMEDRAEKLERRILEGVLDQSRSVLLGARPASNLSEMNLKRVPSSATQAGKTNGKIASSPNRTHRLAKSPAVPTTNVLGNTVSKALKRTPVALNTASPAGSARSDRRILSLSTISGNRRGGKNNLVLADPSSPASKDGLGAGFGALKRSHSVKSSIPSRKTSWSHARHLAPDNQVLDVGKENNVLEEEDEDSEAGTEKHSSISGFFSDAALETASHPTRSLADGASDTSVHHRYSTSSLVATLDESDHEEQLEAEVTSGNQLQLYTGAEAYDFALGEKHVILYGKDSGIGSEPPTASLANNGRFFNDDDSD